MRNKKKGAKEEEGANKKTDETKKECPKEKDLKDREGEEEGGGQG